MKEKGWIARTESGKLAITVEGVDWIAYKDRLFRKDRLIEGGSQEEPSPAQPDPSERGHHGPFRILPGEELTG
jgi:hypothetical protein